MAEPTLAELLLQDGGQAIKNGLLNGAKAWWNHEPYAGGSTPNQYVGQNYGTSSPAPALPYGILNGNDGPDYRGLNPDAGNLPALDAAMKRDPYADLDKKQKEEAARKAALGVFDTGGAAAVPAAGISGQQAMNVGPFGALSPVLPPQAAPAVAGAPAQSDPQSPPVIPGRVPMPVPRPAAAPAPIGAPSIDDTTLPANATPTSGQGGPPAIPETSLMGRIGDGLKQFGEKIDNNKSTLLALAGGLAGAPSWGTGLSRGFTAAAAAQPMDQKITNQNQTVQALMKRGMPEDMARSAAGNPAILQQILPQVFGAKQRKFTQIGEDMMGNKQFGFVDEASGKTYDMSGQPIDQQNAGAGAGIPKGPDGQPLSGQPLLQHLKKNDPVTAAAIKGMIAGDLNAQGRNLQKLAPLASLVDPTFDATQYPVRLKTRESYTSGKDFAETQALNTVGGHLGKLMTSADALGNSNVPAWNKAQNWFADNFTGSPALVKFRNDLVTTSNELAKAYHGGHVSDSAYAAFNKAVNESQTPAELKAAIGELGGLLQSKIEAKESGYRSSMANAPLPNEYRSINEEAKHSFQRVNDWANGNAPQPGAAAVRVNSPADAAKLPKGTRFVDPNGVERIVP